DESDHAAFQEWRCDYQYGVGDRVSGQSGAARLFGNERSNRCLHSFAFTGAGGEENPRECRGAGADLDAADSVDLSGERGRYVWVRYATRKGRRARGSGDVVCVSGIG